MLQHHIGESASNRTPPAVITIADIVSSAGQRELGIYAYSEPYTLVLVDGSCRFAAIMHCGGAARDANLDRKSVV